MTAPDPQESVNVDMERVVRGVTERAAAALAQSWLDAARADAVVAALIAERNDTARATEAAQAEQARKP